MHRKDQALPGGQHHLLHGRAGTGRIGQGVFTCLHRARRNFDAGGAGGIDLEDFVGRRARGGVGVSIPETGVHRVHAAHGGCELHGAGVHMARQNANRTGNEGERRALVKAVREKEAGPAGGGVTDPRILVIEPDVVGVAATRVGLHRPGGVAGREGLKDAPVEIAAVVGVAGDHADRPGAVGAVAVERVEVAADAPAEAAGLVLEVSLQRVPGHQVGLVALERCGAVEGLGDFGRADDAVVDAHVVDVAFPEAAWPFLDIITTVQGANAQAGGWQRSFHGAGADLDAIDVDGADVTCAGDGVLVPFAVAGEGVVDLPVVAQAHAPVAAGLFQHDEKIVDRVALGQDGVLVVAHIAGDLCPDRHREVTPHGQTGIHGVDEVVLAVKAGVAQGTHIGRLQLDRDFAQVVVGGVAGAELQCTQHTLVSRCTGVAHQGEHPGAGVVVRRDPGSSGHGQGVTTDEVTRHLFNDADSDFADGVVAGVRGVRPIGVAERQTSVDRDGGQGIVGVGADAERATFGEAQNRGVVDQGDGDARGGRGDGLVDAVRRGPLETVGGVAQVMQAVGGAGPIRLRGVAQAVEVRRAQDLVEDNRFTRIEFAVAVGIEPEGAMRRQADDAHMLQGFAHAGAGVIGGACVGVREHEVGCGEAVAAVFADGFADVADRGNVVVVGQVQTEGVTLRGVGLASAVIGRDLDVQAGKVGWRVAAEGAARAVKTQPAGQGGAVGQRGGVSEGVRARVGVGEDAQGDGVGPEACAVLGLVRDDFGHHRTVVVVGEGDGEVACGTALAVIGGEPDGEGAGVGRRVAAEAQVVGVEAEPAGQRLGHATHHGLCGDGDRVAVRVDQGLVAGQGPRNRKTARVAAVDQLRQITCRPHRGAVEVGDVEGEVPPQLLRVVVGPGPPHVVVHANEPAVGVKGHHHLVGALFQLALLQLTCAPGVPAPPL